MTNIKSSSSWLSRVFAILGSSVFYKVVLALFVIESLWIALSNHYPMAFDEDYHFGLIKIYSDHINPFLGSQPDSANAYGAMFRDPSYFYHYLMSFIYSAISIFTSNISIQVILLRIINIALFLSGLVMFKKFFNLAKISSAMSNVILALLVLVPIVPVLAGQINYDNLLFLVTGLGLWLTLKIKYAFSNKQPFPIEYVIFLSITCLLGSLVKYAFLPISLALFLYLVIACYKYFRNQNNSISRLRNTWNGLKLTKRYALIFLLFISSLLFSQRYLVNIAIYRTPVPDCNKVMSVEACQEYGPWARDYLLHNTLITDVQPNPVYYSSLWLDGMWYRLFFSIAGSLDGYSSNDPLTIPIWTAKIFVYSGIVLIIVFWRKIQNSSYKLAFNFMFYVSSFYIVVLWADAFEAYLRTGHPVAVNGRYILPIMPLLIATFGITFSVLLKSNIKRKTMITLIILFGMSWGGGVMTFVLRSEQSWYWNSSFINVTNNTIRSIVGPLTPGYN